LDRHADDAAGLGVGGFAGVFEEVAREVGGVLEGLLFDPVEQLGAGGFGAQARDALQLAAEFAVIQQVGFAAAGDFLALAAVTVSFAAIKVLEKIFSTFLTKTALVIGAGETGELAALHLKEKGIGNLYITNRTKSRAEALAQKLNGKVIDFNSLTDSLDKFDIIISATSSDNYIIEYDDVKTMMKKRKGVLTCIMDIAIPRDVNPKVANIDGVFYNDIDSLNIIVNENLRKREKEIPLVNKIIMEEMTSFFKWYNTLDVVPTIKEFRDFFEEIRRDEIEKIKYKIHDYEFEKVDNMTKRIIGRILHNPTWHLKRLSETGTDYEAAKKYSEMVRELFNLNGKDDNNEEE